MMKFQSFANFIFLKRILVCAILPLMMLGKDTDELCYYANDEALANAFAYRALQTRLLNKRHPIFNDIKSFMNSQPFVYKLGLQIVAATEIDDFTIKSYITNQCKTKYTNYLANPRMWFYNVNNRFWPFDKYYVKNLISILYP